MIIDNGKHSNMIKNRFS